MTYLQERDLVRRSTRGKVNPSRKDAAFEACLRKTSVGSIAVRPASAASDELRIEEVGEFSIDEHIEHHGKALAYKTGTLGVPR